MNTTQYVSDARLAELPVPLRKVAVWAEEYELENLQDLQNKQNATPPLRQRQAEAFATQVLCVAAKSHLPADLMSNIFVRSDQQAPTELRHRTDEYFLRAQKTRLIVGFNKPQEMTADPIQGALMLARRILSISLEDGRSGKSHPLKEQVVYEGAAHLRIDHTRPGAFLRGMSPSCWIYAESGLILCAFPPLVDKRPNAFTPVG